MSHTSQEEPAAVAPQKRKRRRRPRRSQTPSLIERTEYALVRTVGAGLRLLPIDATSSVFGKTFGAIMPLTGRHKRALENIAYALPELDAREHDRILRGMWRNLGSVGAEAFAIDRLIEDPARVDLPEDFEHYKALSRDGAITATAHLGNWELSGAVARRGELDFCAVYRAMQNPLVEEYLKKMRSPAYPRGLYAKGASLGTTLVRLAREGVGIGMVADFREFRGVPVRFFGKDATGTPLPAMLSRLSGRPLIAGAVLRTKGVHFSVTLREIEVSQTDDRDRDIQEATQRMHDAFEEWIRQAPEQWMWTHRKWARSRKAPVVPVATETIESAS